MTAVPRARRGRFRTAAESARITRNPVPAPDLCDAAEDWLVVVTLTVALDGPLPESVIELVCMTQVAGKGAPGQARFTVAVEPFCGVTDSWKVAFYPAGMVFVSPTAVIVNAGAGAFTVCVRALDVLPANRASPL